MKNLSQLTIIPRGRVGYEMVGTLRNNDGYGDGNGNGNGNGSVKKQ